MERRESFTEGIMFTQLEMPPEDKNLIINFTKKVTKWAPASLTSIILYGSIAKGFFPEDYDIDIVLLFSANFDHDKFYREVYDIIEELKPHRTMHVVLKWAGELEPLYRDLIDREGHELFH